MTACSRFPRSGRAPSPFHSRRGLTLIEVLISLALSGLLLSAVYSSISMYFHYSHSGHEEIANNQLARVLLLRIEQDLRSIVYRPEDAATAETSDPTMSDSGEDTDSETTTTTTETTVTDPSDAFAGSASGLFGDMQTIVLHVSRPRLDMLSLPPTNGPTVVSRTSDLKTVSYFIAGSGSGGLQAAAAAHFATQNVNGTGQSSGLARMEGDRLALQLADKSGNVSSLLGQTQMLAPEVSRINFRYYDGSVWSTQWDSGSYGGLPRAVEVQLELSFAPETTGQGRYKKSKQKAPRIYRTVVFLPLSKPLMTTGS